MDSTSENSKPKMLIEITKDTNLDSRDFHIAIDGKKYGYYIKEGEFSDQIRFWLSENPDGEIIVRNSSKWKAKLEKDDNSEDSSSSSSDE